MFLRSTSLNRNGRLDKCSRRGPRALTGLPVASQLSADPTAWPLDPSLMAGAKALIPEFTVVGGELDEVTSGMGSDSFRSTDTTEPVDVRKGNGSGVVSKAGSSRSVFIEAIKLHCELVSSLI